MKFYWSIGNQTDSSWNDKIKTLQMQMKDINDMKVKDKGILSLRDGTEVFYIVCSYVLNGEYNEGFFGVINFKNSESTIHIIDIAKKEKYNFDLTKEFVETIGPPK